MLVGQLRMSSNVFFFGLHSNKVTYFLDSIHHKMQGRSTFYPVELIRIGCVLQYNRIYQ
jgi:hypothetical protein